MVVLKKLNASSLMEALVSLFLTVVVFSVSAGLIHSFYLKGIDNSALRQRNLANAIVYFHHFDQLEKFNLRYADSTIYRFSINKTASSVSVSFLTTAKLPPYVYMLE